MARQDALGDRCKGFEQAEVRHAMTGLPLLVRLDGRAFHTFTRDLRRPFDERMQRCMIETTKCLVDNLHARIGYTQSDEMTLLWYISPDTRSQFPFDGRFQKLVSVLAGLASARFVQLVQTHLPHKSEETPCFDARAWQVPTREDALDVFLWREADAVKNSISMAAGAYYSANELHGRDSVAKQEMLHVHGVNWNDYPAAFKRGTYVRRGTVMRGLTEEERRNIPEKHRPAADELFERGILTELVMPPLRRVHNAIDVLFEGAAPVLRGSSQDESANS